MKRIFANLLVLVLSVSSISAYAVAKSDVSEEKSKKEIKAEEKAEEEAKEEVLETKLFTVSKTAIGEMEFVIKAQRLTFPNGRTLNCDESTNFISASDGETVVQISFPNVGYGGFNGLGGITVDGRITGEKSSETRKGNITLRYSVSGSSLSAQIFITLLKDSNEVIVDVEPNFSGNRLTVYGTLYPAGRSSVYQGSTIMAVPRL
ncbi:MAG: DUF4251 domain-containing protein [Bacteroidales bacterium]